MTHSGRRRALPLALALQASLTLGALAHVQPACAQDAYPAKPIRLIVGFAPGGGSDIVGRLLARKWGPLLNTAVVVQNMDGAGSNIAAEYVAKAPADGYTVLLNTSAQVLSRALGEKLNYDLVTDLAPVALIGASPFVLAVHPTVPAGNLNEFIAHLKANQDKLAYGSGGVATANNLAALLFLQANNTSALHVPYKGSGPVMVDLAAGRIQFSMQPIPAILNLARDKRLRVLGFAGLKRSPLLPEVPTFDEMGMKGFEVASWNGVVVPAKTPSAIIRRLNAETVKTLYEADMKAQLALQNVEPISSTPEEYGAYMRREIDRWTKVVKSAGIKPE